MFPFPLSFIASDLQNLFIDFELRAAEWKIYAKLCVYVCVLLLSLIDSFFDCATY